MIRQVEDISLNMNIPCGVEKIFFLCDKTYKEIDTMLIIEDSNYQLFFDEGVLFLQNTNMPLNDYLEDFEKKIIFTIKNTQDNSLKFKYENNYFYIEYESNKFFKFLIQDDIFQSCVIDI